MRYVAGSNSSLVNLSSRPRQGAPPRAGALPEGGAVGARLGFSHSDPTDFRIAVGDEGEDACVKGTLGPAGHLGDDLLPEHSMSVTLRSKSAAR
jgi:hypothetical protein